MASVLSVDALDLAPSNPFITPEEQATVEQKKAALDKLLEDKDLAKYKIEVLFGKGFAPNKPSHGAMSFWESGSKFHGGGDTILHLCPGKSLGLSDCDAFIPDASHGYELLICSQCGHTWKGEQVSGQILARLTAQGWAALVLKYFRKLEMRADIYVKYHPTDIRSAAALEQARQRGGEELLKARVSQKRIYPLKNLIKDTSAGASLESRLLAFLRS